MRTNDWKHKIVEEYLIRYYKPLKSRVTVRSCLKTFFTTMNKDPAKWLKQTPKTIQDDLYKFAQKIENNPSKTQTGLISHIKTFLERNDIELKRTIWNEIQTRNNLDKVRATTKKKTPTAADLKKILSYATNIKARAYFMLLASSGLRAGECVRLSWSDINIENRMIRLNEDVAKDSIPRFTFFSDEAKELLELWKPECKKYLIAIKKENDKRVFPFEIGNFEKIWCRLIDKAGHPYNDKDDNKKLKHSRYMYNIHSIRRFWFTQLRSDRMNDEFYNYIGGHTSLLDRTYGDWLDDETMQTTIKREYDTHAKALSIFEVRPDLTKITDEIEELKSENQEMKMKILELMVSKHEQQIYGSKREKVSKV